MEKPHIIGITGLSGAGKTYTTVHLQEKFPEDILALSHDNYYKDAKMIGVDRWEKVDYDNPQAYDNEILIQHLKDLLAGKEIEAYLYDFGKHERINQKEKLAPKRIILIEGLFVFNMPALRELIDLKVFLDARADIRFCRRFLRDIRERGIDNSRVKWFIDQYLNHIKPNQESLVLPMRHYANLIINTNAGGKEAVKVLSEYIEDIKAGKLGSVELKKKFEIH